MFKIIVPSYNNEEWIERCLQSIVDQEYKDFEVLVIDDAATDGQRSLIRDFVAGRENWMAFHNSENRKCPANLVRGISFFNPAPEEIIVLVDGDDFLPHPGVLTRVAEAYENPDVWLTYGNYEPWPENTGQVKAEAYSKEEIEQRDFRTRILFNHLITFKMFLWSEIPLSAFRYDDGKWLDVGYDRSIMFPMLEMAGERHLFIDENLYTYNAVNSLSDVHVRLQAAQVVHRLLRDRPKFDRLGEPSCRHQAI